MPYLRQPLQPAACHTLPGAAASGGEGLFAVLPGAARGAILAVPPEHVGAAEPVQGLRSEARSGLPGPERGSTHTIASAGGD